MAKTSARTATKKTKRSVRRTPVAQGSLLSGSEKGFWGKDQPMILLLSAGIIVFVVVGLYMAGWL